MLDSCNLYLTKDAQGIHLRHCILFMQFRTWFLYFTYFLKGEVLFLETDFKNLATDGKVLQKQKKQNPTFLRRDKVNTSVSASVFIHGALKKNYPWTALFLHTAQIT